VVTEENAYLISADSCQKRWYTITTAAADGINIGTRQCRHKFLITTAVADESYLLTVVSGINTDSGQRHKILKVISGIKY
jgi:hypothetical protein